MSECCGDCSNKKEVVVSAESRPTSSLDNFIDGFSTTASLDKFCASLGVSKLTVLFELLIKAQKYRRALKTIADYDFTDSGESVGDAIEKCKTQSPQADWAYFVEQDMLTERGALE